MKIKGHFDHDDIQRLIKENWELRRALRHQVKPTIKLLEKVRQQAYLGAYWSDELVLAREIDRLRTACGEKQK